MPIFLPQRIPLVRRPVPVVPSVCPSKSLKVPKVPTNRPSPIRSLPSWVYSLELAGQGIVYFTMFYCSMNWLFYRNLRKDAERNEAEAKPKAKAEEKNKDDKKP